VKKKESQIGLIIAAIVVVGLVLAGISVVTDGPDALSLRRAPDLPIPASTSSRTTASQARGQYIEVPDTGLTADQRTGTAWTGVPATPLVVPRVRYADGQPVPQEDVPKVLGYDGQKVRRPRSAESGGETPLGELHRPISADEFWEGLADANGSPGDVAAIPGSER